MNHRFVSALAACIILCPFALPATAQEPAVLENHCEIIGKEITDSMAVDLLDPAAPGAARQRALDAYMALADEKGCSSYGYSIGLLYRFGADLPGNLLQRDIGKARDLILRYAEDGNLIAYADLAEMALADSNAREAMKWAQVYLAFLSNSDIEFRNGNDAYYRSGYNGDLLLRAERAWSKQRPKLSRELIRSDLEEYLRLNKVQVLERIMASGSDERGPRRGTKGMEDVFPTIRGKCEVDLRDIGGAYARYLIEVQPDGRVSRVTIRDFAPSPIAAIKLAQCVKVYQFQPFKGPAPRVSIMPVVYGYTDGPRISK